RGDNRKKSHSFISDRVKYNFKSCVPVGKGRKPDRAVPVVEFMERKTPHEKIQISAKLLFVAHHRLCWSAWA
ncbi:MAG TPA: hypothetical protein PK992_19755, partial [Planctomycetaceae bacterium]|nr:hypothetical protein [Planctomycetaceae bacterium]